MSVHVSVSVPREVRLAFIKALADAAAIPADSRPADIIIQRAELIATGTASAADVRAIAMWHKRNSKREVAWDLHGGAKGRDWAYETVASFSLDPSAVHVNQPANGEPAEREPPTAPPEEDVDAVINARATEYEDAPFVDHAWDAAAAVERLRKWAGVDGENPPASAWAKYAKGFAVVDGDGSKLGEYHLPHHDVVDGKFVTIPAAVSAAIGALNGARGGMKGLSESERKAALAHLEKHQHAWQEQQKKSARGTPCGDLRVATFSDVDTSNARSSADAPIISISILQLATVGEFKGHHSGPFELTPAIFDTIVANFRRYPHDVPLDFEHGSEQVGPGSSIYQHGAPAVGWIVDLENRGEDGLYGTVEWVDKRAVDLVRNGQYRYLSPAIDFGAIDPKTGKEIGAQLVSAALTNRPFLPEIAAVAARANRPPRSASATPPNDNPAGVPAEHSDRSSDGRNHTETTMPNITDEQHNELLRDHKALKDAHDALKSEHEKLKAEHSKHLMDHKAFVAKCAEHLGLPATSDETAVHKALADHAQEFEKIKGEHEARAKAEAEADAEMVAARVGRKDDAEYKKTLLAMRTAAPKAFIDAFLPLFAEPPRQVAPPPPVAPPAPTSLAARVAGMNTPGSGPTQLRTLGAARTAAEMNAVVNDTATKLMRENPSRYADPQTRTITHIGLVQALSDARALVEAGQA